MDGNLVLGDRDNQGLRALAGADRLFAALTERGLPFRVFTNRHHPHPRQYAHALGALGFPVPDGVLTPTSSGGTSFGGAGTGG